MGKWCAVIFGIICIICWIIGIIKEVRASRRMAPYGKVFKKEFAEIIDNIYKAQNYSKNEHMPVFTNGMKFDIRVAEYKQIGLEYSTIPMYKYFDIYINEELVCREHIIKEFSKDKVWFEFSSKRKRDEIINIIKEADAPAKEILNKGYKEIKESLELIHKSFFEYSHTEDK